MPFPENYQNVRGIAKPRKKLRKSKERPHWETDWINNADPMRCKETRNKKHGGYIDTSTAVAPEAIRELPRHEFNAYRAKELNSQAAHQPLFDLLLDIVTRLSEAEEWSFNKKAKHPQLECLASLVLAEFLYSSRFNKRTTEKPVFAISALSNAMHMDRITYNAHWHKRFLVLRPIIRKWHLDGIQRVKYR